MCVHWKCLQLVHYTIALFFFLNWFLVYRLIKVNLNSIKLARVCVWWAGVRCYDSSPLRLLSFLVYALENIWTMETWFDLLSHITLDSRLLCFIYVFISKFVSDIVTVYGVLCHWCVHAPSQVYCRIYLAIHICGWFCFLLISYIIYHDWYNVQLLLNGLTLSIQVYI